MIDYGVRGVEVFHLALETCNILKKKQLWLNEIEKIIFLFIYCFLFLGSVLPPHCSVGSVLL